MAEKDRSKSFADMTARGFGYKNAKEMKDDLKKGQGGSLSGNIKGRLASGEGFGEAFKGGLKDKLSLKGFGLDKESLKQKAISSAFGGGDIFSAYMRGRLKNKDEGTKTEESPDDKKSGGLESEEATTLLKIIAKNAISLHLMSRDMNVIRQNIIKMVKHETDKKEGGNKKKKKGTKDSQDATNKADTWFMREDEREKKLETERSKFGKKEESKSPTPEKPKDDCGGICDTVMNAITNMLTNGLVQGLKMLFNPANILKVLGRVFIIGAILFSLFEGVMAGWEKWQETGDLGEAIKEGLAAMIDFLTLGLFGKDNIKKMFDAVTDFFKPIIDSIKDIYYAVKDWIANNIGMPEITIPIPGWMQKLGAPEKISIGPWYPYKDDPSSSAEQVSKREETPKDEGGKSSKETASTPTKSSNTIGGSVTVNGGDQGDVVNNFSNLQRANKELQDLNVQYMREKVSLLGSPNFETEKAALVQKYKPLIDAKKKEISSYASVPGVKEMAEKQGINISATGSIIDEESTSPTPAPAAASTASETAPKPAPAEGSASTSPTQTGGGDQAPSTLGVTAPETSPTATSGGESGGSVPSGGATTQSAAAPAASASDVSAPTEDTTPPPMSDSGGAISSTSSEVAEAQRMESAADMGSTINAPITNSSKSSSSEGKPPIASAWDKTFLDFYATT